MGLVGRDLYRCLFFPADVLGAGFSGRDRQAVVYRACCLIRPELGVGFDTDNDIRQLYPERGETG